MSYDSTILADAPIFYLTDSTTDQGSGHYPILTHGGASASNVLPNGDVAWSFDSSGTQFLSVADPADGSLSINKTGKLTVEMWMQLGNVNQPHNAPGLNGGCEVFGKSVSNNTPQVSTDGCEWLFRYYSANSTDGGNTPTDVCYYAFNKACGFGAGNDDHIDSTNGYTKNASDWYYFVGVYDTTSQTVSGVSFPYGAVTLYGGIYGNSKWNGVFLNRAGLQVTWAAGQPIIRPSHTTTPLTIGACGLSSNNFAPEGTQSYFYGHLAKLAIYDTALTPTQIHNHFLAMVAGSPSPTPTPTPTVPSAPTNIRATAGNGQAAITWSAPSDGGSPIYDYIITPWVGSSAGSTVHVGNATSYVFSGLTNGTSYYFKVRAINAVGQSSPGVSNMVTPQAPSVVTYKVLSGNPTSYPTEAGALSAVQSALNTGQSAYVTVA